jgi:penicillin-binding protein 2
MKKIGNFAFALLFILTACAGKGGTQSPNTTPTSSKPTPVVQTTSIPDVPTAAKDFLDKWKASDYTGMYALLAKTSQDALSETDFEKKYTDAANNMTTASLDYGIVSTLITPTTAKVGYVVNFTTSLFNVIQKQTEMDMILENGTWKIQWDDSMIVPELKGGNHLLLNITHPVRGNILDRNGDPIVSNTDAVALGLDPANLSSKTISKSFRTHTTPALKAPTFPLARSRKTATQPMPVI